MSLAHRIIHAVADVQLLDVSATTAASSSSVATTASNDDKFRSVLRRHPALFAQLRDFTSPANLQQTLTEVVETVSAASAKLKHQHQSDSSDFGIFSSLGDGDDVLARFSSENQLRDVERGCAALILAVMRRKQKQAAQQQQQQQHHHVTPTRGESLTPPPASPAPAAFPSVTELIEKEEEDEVSPMSVDADQEQQQIDLSVDASSIAARGDADAFDAFPAVGELVTADQNDETSVIDDSMLRQLGETNNSRTTTTVLSPPSLTSSRSPSRSRSPDATKRRHWQHHHDPSVAAAVSVSADITTFADTSRYEMEEDGVAPFSVVGAPPQVVAESNARIEAEMRRIADEVADRRAQGDVSRTRRSWVHQRAPTPPAFAAGEREHEMEEEEEGAGIVVDAGDSDNNESSRRLCDVAIGNNNNNNNNESSHRHRQPHPDNSRDDDIVSPASPESATASPEVSQQQHILGDNDDDGTEMLAAVTTAVSLDRCLQHWHRRALLKRSIRALALRGALRQWRRRTFERRAVTDFRESAHRRAVLRFCFARWSRTFLCNFARANHSVRLAAGALAVWRQRTREAPLAKALVAMRAFNLAATCFRAWRARLRLRLDAAAFETQARTALLGRRCFSTWRRRAREHSAVADFRLLKCELPLLRGAMQRWLSRLHASQATRYIQRKRALAVARHVFIWWCGKSRERQSAQARRAALWEATVRSDLVRKSCFERWRRRASARAVGNGVEYAQLAAVFGHWRKRALLKRHDAARARTASAVGSPLSFARRALLI